MPSRRSPRLGKESSLEGRDPGGPGPGGGGTPWWWWYEGGGPPPHAGPPSGRCTSALCMALGGGPPTSAPPTFHVCDPFGTSDTLGSSPLFSRRWLGRLIGLGAAMRPRETMRPTRWPPGLRASGRGVRIGAGRSGEFARRGLTARLGQRFEDRRRSSRARDLRGIAREAVDTRGAAMRSEGVRESRAIDPRGVRRTWSSSRSTISTGRDSLKRRMPPFSAGGRLNDGACAARKGRSIPPRAVQLEALGASRCWPVAAVRWTRAPAPRAMPRRTPRVR